jgi:ATP-dependent helicase IRC3
MMQLRPFQKDALSVSLKKWQEGVTRQVIQLPTGTGKTPLFAGLRDHHQIKGRVMVLVPREELAKQARDRLLDWNPGARVGIEMGQEYYSAGEEFVVASVATVGRENTQRLAKFNPEEFDAVVVDECHHAVLSNRSYTRVFEHFNLLAPHNKKLLLGVTATPNRGDSQALGQTFDEIIYEMSILRAIEEGWLVNLRGIRIHTNADLSKVKTNYGDFNVGELEEAVNTHETNYQIVQGWKKHGGPRQTVAFCVDIAHALDMANMFLAHGVAAQPIWGEDPLRAEKIAMHKSGELKVLTNCNVLTEGYDDWRLGCIIMARPTKSQLLYVQMCGRGTRLPEVDGKSIGNLVVWKKAGKLSPKDDCLILDVSANSGKHSLVTLGTIFGLPPNLDLEGKTVTEAKAAVSAAQADRPDLDLEKLRKLKDLETLAEHVDLFAIRWSQEVLDNSELAWHKTSDGSFVLLMPNKESVCIWEDLLGKWNVTATINGNAISEKGYKDVPDAFSFAHQMLNMFGKHLLTLLRREAKWHGEPATPGQMDLLKKFAKADRRLARAAHMPNLTKGEAKQLIDNFINKQYRGK